MRSKRRKSPRLFKLQIFITFFTDVIEQKFKYHFEGLSKLFLTILFLMRFLKLEFFSHIPTMKDKLRAKNVIFSVSKVASGGCNKIGRAHV